MTDSPAKTKRSSTSSPPTRPKPESSNQSFLDHPVSLVLLVVFDIVLAIVAIYLIQEGQAQHDHSNLQYFVAFPQEFLWAPYVALIILIPNFAITLLAVLRRLRYRRWPWVITGISAVLLGLIVWKIGFSGLLTVIDPSR